ncbi:hypothetical protein JOB18_036279 [Solea senegalensis]|uniref:Uncharacterized protein n=1 Tax=Solea senegalensis TaxID=28829 RepID=A0AAV6S5Q3_SOLSE|nr:hypothetical protein JOB18_036279 [Solea senegalensis]
MKRRKSWTEQRRWIPGLTVAESQDPEALDRQLRRLQAQRTALLDTRSCCVSLDVKDQLDTELRTHELRRDELSTENKRLSILWRRLRSVCGRLSHWEDDEQQVPLEDLLSSMLEDMRLSGETNGDDVELFEDEEPSGVNESELVNDHALLVTVPPGVQLSPSLSSQCVLMALSHGALRLLTHAVTQNKLSFSEQLGDVLTEHAQQNMGVADQCLALASLLTERRSSDRCRRAAILSVGVACSTLLAADPPHQEVALQLLDGLVQRGRESNSAVERIEVRIDLWSSKEAPAPDNLAVGLKYQERGPAPPVPPPPSEGNESLWQPDIMRKRGGDIPRAGIWW